MTQSALFGALLIFLRRPEKMKTIQSKIKRLGLKKHDKPKKSQEKLSERDLKNLMGTNRPTYKRHKGAYRQK